MSRSDEDVYIWIPRPDNDPGNNAVRSEKGGHFVRTDPAKLCKRAPEFFRFISKDSRDGSGRPMEANGIEALMSDGIPLTRSAKVLSTHIDGTDDALIAGYDRVGELLVEHIVDPIKHLRDTIKLLQAGKYMQADQDLAVFIGKIHSGCYALADEFSVIEDVNGQLRKSSAHAETAAAEARREAARQAAITKTAMATLRRERREQLENWIEAALSVNELVNQWQTQQRHMQNRLNAAREQMKNRQNELDPEQEPNSGYLKVIAANMPAIQAYAKDGGNTAAIGSGIKQACEAIGALEQIQLMMREEHDVSTRKLSEAAQIMTAQARAMVERLRKSMNTLRACHDDYLDKTKRWTTGDEQPYLPYQPESGFSELITQGQYEEALASITDPQRSAASVLASAEHVAQIVRELTDEAPSYPQTLLRSLEEHKSWIMRANKRLKSQEAADLLAVNTNDDAEADADASPAQEAVIVLSGSSMTVRTAAAQSAPTASEFDPTEAAAATATEEPEPQPAPPAEAAPVSAPEPVLQPAAAPAALDPSHQLLEEFVLLAAWVMTAQGNNPLYGQRWDRLMERALHYIARHIPGLQIEAPEETSAALRSYAADPQRCVHIPMAPGHMSRIQEAWSNSPLPWIYYDLNQSRRRGIFKLASSARARIDALVAKHSFKMADAVSEEVERRTAARRKAAASSTQEDEDKEAVGEPESPADKAATQAPPVASMEEEPPSPPSLPPETEEQKMRREELSNHLLRVAYVIFQFGNQEPCAPGIMMRALHLMRLCSAEEAADGFVQDLVLRLPGNDRHSVWSKTQAADGRILLAVNARMADMAELIYSQQPLHPSSVAGALSRAARP